MNAVMAGMIPVMVILTSRDMSAMEPSSVRFWGMMSLAFMVSTVTTYPVNWWLVKRGLKHGMGGEARARRLRHSVSAASKLAATFLTLVMLAGGVALAARYGGFSMRAGDRKMEADSGQSREAAKSPEGFKGEAVFLPLYDITMAAQPPRQPRLARTVNFKAP
jgi:Domain of unknown function (DUF4396)